MKTKENKKNKFPERIMAFLRQREGLACDDEGRDGYLNTLSPRGALREVCAWKLGDAGWAEDFIEWAEECGFDVIQKRN